MDKFSLYRKAIAALIGGLVPLIVSMIPAVQPLADPVAVNIASAILAAVAVALTADKLAGADVVALAKAVIAAFDQDAIEVSEVPIPAAHLSAQQGDLVIPRAGRDPLVVTPIIYSTQPKESA